MMRLVKLLGIAILALAVYFATQWMQLNPGNVQLEWFGYQITASIFLVFAALTFVFIVLHSVLNGINWLITAPKRRRDKQQIQRYEKGLVCLGETFSALAMDDKREARKSLARARKHLTDAPVTLLLEAQLERENTDPAKRQALLESLRTQKATQNIAERGLLEEALQAGKLEEATELAQSMFAKRPKDSWLALTLMDILSRQSEFAAALDTLKKSRGRGVIPAKDAAHYSASIRFAWASASDDIALKQLQLERASEARPNFAPAIVALIACYETQNKGSAARHLIEKSYKQAPSRALANAYRASLAALAEPKQRKRCRALALKAPNHADSQLWLAELALEEDSVDAARDFAKAALIHQERGDIFGFLSTLEAQNGDETQAEIWKQRSNTAPHGDVYKCSNCGEMQIDWSLHCGECSAFDTLETHFPAQIVVENLPVSAAS